MRGTAQDSTIFPPRPLNLLAAHLFAHVAKLDEGHTGAPDLEDWDWLRVDEDLAELGVVTLTAAHTPTPRFDVTWRRDTAAAWFRWRGVGGYILQVYLVKEPADFGPSFLGNGIKTR